jgi:hypothetical protein
MRGRGLLLAIVFVLGTNALALVGVSLNRRGEPTARLTLTERELPLARTGGPADDSTAMTLRLQWSERGAGFDGAMPGWFDQTKLEAIGFDCGGPVDAASGRRPCRGALPRRTWLVLEYEGPAWDGRLEEKRRDLAAMEAKAASGEATTKDLESARDEFDSFARTQSRLLAVDAGNDAAALARRYTDPARYAIVAAVVRPRLSGDPARPVGWIERVLVSAIDVPAAHRSALETLPPLPAAPPPAAAGPRAGQDHRPGEGAAPQKPVDPRYTVTLCFGSRHEPWVEQVRALPSPAPGPAAAPSSIDKTLPAR